MDRIHALEATEHDAECREIVAELISRLEIARRGAHQMTNEVDHRGLRRRHTRQHSADYANAPGIAKDRTADQRS
jgi:hypothetical protein